MATMTTSSAIGWFRISGICLAGAAVIAFGAPTSAQDVGSLVTYRSENRAGSPAAAAVIAEMIAERSESAAVRSRARSMAPQGALQLGAEELLADIGAYTFVGAVTGSRAAPIAPAVTPAALPAAPVVRAPAAPPIAAPAPATAAAPASAPGAGARPPAAAPATAQPVAVAPSPQQRTQNWGVSDTFSGEMRDLGGTDGGGGGGWN
jgi:hypothetical protein